MTLVPRRAELGLGDLHCKLGVGHVLEGIPNLVHSIATVYVSFIF